MAAGGWLLSAVRSLTPFTLGLLVLVGIGVWMWVIRHDRQSAVGEIRRTFRRWCRFRSRRALPALFMAIAVVSIGGATLNEPYNYDSFWYRIPRMHHWLAERQWHWVHTHEFRINASAAFSEWINMPVFAWFRGYRALFLGNLISFLLLPGTFFALLVALGVSRRVAWHWMWILPTGWVYAFQAGSLANDIASAPLIMAAVLYGLHAAGRIPHALAWSIVSAAILSGAKMFFVPLLLAWVVSIGRGWREAFTKPLLYFPLAAIAGLASMLPLGVASHQYAGTWLGTSNTGKFIPEHPLFAIVANAILALVTNLVPPFTPGASQWNQTITTLTSQPPLSNWTAGFEAFGTLYPGTDETGAGLGFTVTLLVLSVLLHPKAFTKPVRWPNPFLSASIAIALAALLAKVGTPQMNRYFAPYYPLLLALVLHAPSALWLTRQRWWHRAAIGSGLLALFMAMLSRQHPFPITTDTIQWLHTRWPGNKVLARVNSAYQWRHESLVRYEVALAKIKGEPTVGYLVNGPGEHIFWLAGLRVHDVKPEDDPTRWRNLGVRYLVVDPTLLGSTPLNTWAASRQLRIVERLGETENLKGIETPVYLMELLPTAPAR